MAMFRRLAPAVLVFASACCLSHEVTVLTVRNETPGAIAVRAQLVNSPEEVDELRLEANEERVLVKYEEPKCKTQPASEIVMGLGIQTAGGCRVTFDRATVARLANRDPVRRKWVVHVTPTALAAVECRQ